MNAAISITQVKLAGPLTVPHADRIQAQLLAALDGETPVVVDIAAATEIDVSFLQILVAAQKTAGARQKILSIYNAGSTLLMDEAARCGLAATSAITGQAVLPPLSRGIPS